jgi:hypothetical protein
MKGRVCEKQDGKRTRTRKGFPGCRSEMSSKGGIKSTHLFLRDVPPAELLCSLIRRHYYREHQYLHLHQHSYCRPQHLHQSLSPCSDQLLASVLEMKTVVHSCRLEKTAWNYGLFLVPQHCSPARPIAARQTQMVTAFTVSAEGAPSQRF